MQPRDLPIKRDTNRSNVRADILHDLSHPLQTLSPRSQRASTLQSNQMPTQSSPPNLTSLLPPHSNIISNRREMRLIARSLLPRNSKPSIQNITRVIATNNQRALTPLPALRLTHLDRIEDLRGRGAREDVTRDVHAEIVAADEAAEHGLMAAAGEADSGNMVFCEGWEVAAVDCLEFLVVGEVCVEVG